MSDKQNGSFLEALQLNGISGLISLKSYKGKYLSACPDGKIDWDRDWDREWKQFTVEFHGEGKVTLKSCHVMYLSAKKEVGGTVRCDEREALAYTLWTVEAAGTGIALKSCFGKYLHPKKDGRVTAIHDGFMDN
jgi:hypothetical protein